MRIFGIGSLGDNRSKEWTGHLRDFSVPETSNQLFQEGCDASVAKAPIAKLYRTFLLLTGAE